MLRFLLMLVLALPGLPQDGLPTTVKEIRQRYADTQQSIAMMHEEEHFRSEIVTTIQRNMPGSGIRKYNVAARKFYEEYLFDAETGKLLFVFLQADSIENAGTKDETRYYFGPQGLISETSRENVARPPRKRQR